MENQIKLITQSQGRVRVMARALEQRIQNQKTPVRNKQPFSDVTRVSEEPKRPHAQPDTSSLQSVKALAQFFETRK